MTPTPVPPEHLLIGPRSHGVTAHAALLAAALQAPVLSLDAADELDAGVPRPLGSDRRHVHVTDKLFGRTVEEAADRLVALCAAAPTTVTLHDVPQSSDGGGFARRQAAYRRILAAAAGWAVSSQHERSLVDRHLAPASGPMNDGAVVPLPVGPVTRLAPPPPAPRPVIGILGWVYPGKGHAEVIDAAARLGRPVEVRAVGGVSPGHADLADSLADRAAERGVGWSLTGYLPEATFAAAMAAVTVPVAAHGHVSASGSMTAWLEAGRRPLVAGSAYARETAALRPGCYEVYDELGPALARALRDPASTWLAPSCVPAWDVRDAAAAYRAWFGRLAPL